MTYLPLPELRVNPFEGVRYMGFWARVAAYLVDALVLAFIQGLATTAIFLAITGTAAPSLDVGQAFHPGILLVSALIGLAFTLVCWSLLSATPGKLCFTAIIVDARTGDVPQQWQWWVRYFAIFLSSIPLGLGLFMAAFHPRKQTLHDLLARTVVVRLPSSACNARSMAQVAAAEPVTRAALSPAGLI